MRLQTFSLTCLLGATIIIGGACDGSDPFQPDSFEAPTDAPEQAPAVPLPFPAGVIVLLDADGSNPTALTEGARPAWSPDGQTVAFHRDGHVYRIDRDGSGEIALAEGRHPAWSPAGDRIVFVDDGKLRVMNADGSGVPTLVRPDFRDDYVDSELGLGKPAWSPDGERISFERTIDFGLGPFVQIYIMNPDGSDPRRLTPTRGGQSAESDPAWSSDGSEVGFWSFEFGLATSAAAGGVPRTLYKNFPAVAYGARPAWLPDGSAIAFNVRNAGVFADPEIWIVGSDGGTARALILGARDPAWSPDGSRIAVVSSGRSAE